MRKFLYIMLVNLAVLFLQPAQAAESLIVAGGAGLYYASIFGLYYSLLTRTPELAENEIQKNPDRYKVTDESLTSLIQQEAQKKGLDFSKIIVAKNMAPAMIIVSSAGSVKYLFNVGSEEFLKAFSEVNVEGQKGVVQYELNHAIYNHVTKKMGVSVISEYVGFLVGYAALSMTASYIANYIEKNSPELGLISYLISIARPFISAKFGLYASRCLNEKCYPVYSRYCEKQACLGIDDDPVVVKGLITYFQTVHDQQVIRFGQDFVKQHPEQVDHLTPLERIVYLKEKLQRCSNNDESSSF